MLTEWSAARNHSKVVSGTSAGNNGPTMLIIAQFPCQTLFLVLLLVDLSIYQLLLWLITCLVMIDVLISFPLEATWVSLKLDWKLSSRLTSLSWIIPEVADWEETLLQQSICYAHLSSLTANFTLSNKLRQATTYFHCITFPFRYFKVQQSQSRFAQIGHRFRKLGTIILVQE